MELKRHIVNVTMALVKENGFRNLRVDRIASKADISKRTLYRYFSSKEDLIGFIIKEKHQQIQNEIEAIFEQPGNELSKYEKLLTVVTSNISSFDPELFDTLKKYPELYENIKERQNELSENIEKLIADGIKKGEIQSNFEPKIISFLLIKLANSIFDSSFYINNKVTFEEVSDNLTSLVMNGLIKRD